MNKNDLLDYLEILVNSVVKIKDLDPNSERSFLIGESIHKVPPNADLSKLTVEIDLKEHDAKFTVGVGWGHLTIGPEAVYYYSLPTSTMK